ncbi:hypothetical protein [Desulfosediminicola ganghwensis]|uniref:hypothetical protein n=1 Tax=Desulfosediminicola ganghwensis TaxID=2569540 RepID=UPI0010ACAD5D|nr:hypothetical protein [Desulfosediminicola ganghwensis]
MSEVKGLDFEEYVQWRKDLEDAVKIENDLIILGPQGFYDIEISSCNTYEKILGWAFHLSEKTWMTTDVLRYFIRVACQASDIKVPSV